MHNDKICGFYRSHSIVILVMCACVVSMREPANAFVIYVGKPFVKHLLGRCWEDNVMSHV